MEDFLFSVAILACIFIVFIQANDFGVESMIPPKNALYRDQTKSVEARVADLLSYMTLEEKIGQMTLVEKKQYQGTRGHCDLLSRWTAEWLRI